MPIHDGTRLGRYEIRAKLGAGGMGEVYLAHDTRLSRKVAVKVLPADVVNHPQLLHRFEQEAQAASSLNHQNIITIHEIGEANGTYFIATEFIEGQTLRQKLRVERLETEETLNIAIQIAAALDAAHKSGIVHRDIKPENVMVRSDGLVKVLDFGLAKLTESKRTDIDTEAPTRAHVTSQAGMILGTVAYMSPEQARGLEIDARTDIFSLGIVLYEMLTGRLPFGGATASDIVAFILTKEPVPLDADTPPELQRIVRKSLQKKVDERYQTAKDLLIDLKSLQHDLDFSTELERSGIPTKSEHQSIHTTSSAEYIATGIQQHKRGFMAALGVLLIAALGLGYWYFSYRPSPTTQIESIAVLPFVNESDNPDVEYLADGVTEALINSLSQLPNVRVMARSTMFSFKGKAIDPQAVGKQLGVDAVLTGRVVQLGDNLAIQTDLVKVSEGTQMWGERYSRKASDILAVQEDIVSEIVGKLRLRLSGEQEQRVTKRYTENVEAYEHYLKGRFYWNKRTADNLKRAIKEFQAAAAKDPNYALAYIGLADCYLLIEEYAGTPSSETLPQAKAYLMRALAIDESLAEAHASLGQMHGQAWQWAEAERAYKRAIELNSNYPTAHHWYSLHLIRMGRMDEAFNEIKRAQELDPLSNVINANVAFAYLLKNDFNSSIEQSLKIIELDPNFGISHGDLGLAYLKQGRNSEAIAAAERAVELTDRASEMLGQLGYTYAVAGKRKKAIAVIKELEGKYATREVLERDIAAVYAGLGEKDAAFAWLEKGFQDHGRLSSRIRWHPTFEPLRSDPRFSNLMRRMGLPQ